MQHQALLLSYYALSMKMQRHLVKGCPDVLQRCVALFSLLRYKIFILNIGRETDSWRLAVSTVNGPKAEVSSTMMPRPSSSGLTKRINSVSSLCSQVLTSTLSSTDFPAPALTSRRLPSSPTTVTSATSPLAPPTSAPPSELQSTSDFPSSPRSGTSSRPSLTSTTSRSEVSTVSTLSPPMPPMTSPTSADSAAPRESSSRTCTTVSRL